MRSRRPGEGTDALADRKKSKRSRRTAGTPAPAAAREQKAKSRRSAKPPTSRPSARARSGGARGPAQGAAPPAPPAPETTRQPGPGEPSSNADGRPETTPSPASDGELRFDPGIITEIAVREASEIEGIVELTGGWRTKGVQVTEPEGEEGGYVVDVRVAVEYGVNCVALAETIRNRISGAIHQMTGRRTKAINVHLTGIRDKGLREEPHEEGVPLGEEHGIDF